MAFTPDLGGIAPVEAETAALCRAAAERFSVMGAAVVEACPDLRDAAQVFQVHNYPRNKCMVHGLQLTGLRTSVANVCGLYSYQQSPASFDVRSWALNCCCSAGGGAL